MKCSVCNRDATRMILTKQKRIRQHNALSVPDIVIPAEYEFRCNVHKKR